jgi:hypothetical protein
LKERWGNEHELEDEEMGIERGRGRRMEVFARCVAKGKEQEGRGWQMTFVASSERNSGSEV